MITAIAVDDEPVALDVLSSHAEKISSIRLTNTFASAAEALAHMATHPVELVFIDINMPDMSGLEFAEKVRHQALVVFTTAHPEFALRGYEVAATDYLLKPITLQRFEQACELAMTRLPLLRDQQPKIKNGLFVKDGYDWVKIETDNLLYARAEDNYVSLAETGKRTLTRMTLSTLLAKLPSGQFMQVHKSFVASLRHIEKIEKNHIVIANEKIPVSASYRNNLLKMIRKKQ